MSRGAARLIAALALGVLAELAGGLPAGLAAADLAAGVALLTAPRTLALVTGLAWFAGPLVYLHRGPLFQLIAGTRSRAARIVVGAAYVDGLVPPLARLPWPTIALAAALVAVTTRGRWAALAVGGTLAAAAVLELTHAGFTTAALLAYCAAVAAVGLGQHRRDLVALVVDLGAGQQPDALQAGLRRALDDPTLRIVYRLPDGSWADESGARTPLGGRVTYVGEDTALIHARALLVDGRTLRLAAAAAEVALANARLHAEVADRVDELEASRRRLVEAADAERRRLGAAVAGGPGQRLAAAAARLAGDPLANDVKRARGEIERFAQGLHPPVLTERGLRAALAERASPVAVMLDVPEQRFAPAQEATLFFVAAEALANVAKHAHATHAAVSLHTRDGTLVLTVADDGVGGADLERGTGLRGLADRAEALGGRLRVDSGAGTRVRLELPL